MKAGMRYLCVKQSQSVVRAANFGSIGLGTPTAIGAAIGARIGPRLRWSVTAVA
jgi:thiamine pyrophosphate-dependent acetolactate synthase large subunit-like protein